MEHREKVLDMLLPAHDQPPRVVQPREEALYGPSALIATERATGRGGRADAGVVLWGDKIDRAIVQQLFFVERVTVLRIVANQSRRERREEPVIERGADEPDFRGRSAGHVDGDRKTAAVDDCHDFVAFATFRRPDGGAPFFAPVKLASMNPSVRSSLPRSRRSSASRSSTSRNRPVRCHCWNRRWHV